MRVYREMKISEIFYYLFWVIMIYAKGTGLYEGLREYNICLVLALCCLTVKLLLTRYRIADLLWVVPAGVLSIWIYLHSHDQSALLLAALAIGIKDVKLSRVLKIGLVMWSACFVFSVFRTFSGGYTGPVLVHEKFGLGPIIRWSLGFTHPNVLHITYVVIAALILYCWNLKPGRKQWKISLILMVGNCYVFLYSISSTGFLLMTLLLFFSLYLANRKKISLVEKLLLQCVLPFCLFFSLVLPVVVQEEGWFFTLVNKALNNRYLATRIYLTEMGISLFGEDIPNLFGFAVDCSYTEALLSYGLIAFVGIMAGYMLTIHDKIRNGRWQELAILLALLVAGVSEPFLFNASFKNIIILFVGEYLYTSVCAAAGKKNDIWKKEIRLVSGLDRIIRLEQNDTRELKMLIANSWIKCRRLLYGIGALGAIICILAALIFARRPDSIFIGVGSTDCGEREEKYLDMQSLPDDFNSEVYEYPGPDGAMYEFSGTTTIVEYVRKIISAGVWGLLGVLALEIVLLFLYAYYRSKSRLEIHIRIAEEKR